MKREYDFSTARRGKFSEAVKPDAVFVRFDAQISHLLDGPGQLRDRLLGLARAKSAPRLVRTVAMTPAQYRVLRPLLDRLGAVANATGAERPAPRSPQSTRRPRRAASPKPPTRTRRT